MRLLNMPVKWNRYLSVIMVVLLSMLGGGISSAKTYLVSVGLNVYDNGENPLPCSRADAYEIARLFKSYKDTEVFMLLDKNATRDHILRILKKQFSKAKPEDEVIFAYSGHGFDGGITCYDTKNAVFSSEIQEIMRQCKAKRKIILLNACHSGSFSKKSRDSRNTGYNSQDSDVMLFMSSRASEPSWENTLMKNSYFFDQIIKALRGYADVNKDNIVTARELFNYVYSGVLKLTDGVQHPQMYGKFSDNMEIVRVRRN